jgi:hypothetical protein
MSAACDSTSVKDTWKDPQYAGSPFRNVMVLGVSKSPANRRVFEDGFARALRETGATASPSYPVLPEDGEIPHNRIQRAVDQAGADAVLVTRVLRVDRNIQTSPATMGIGVGRGYYGGGYRGYYGAAWNAPVDVYEYEVLTLESTLWDVKSDKVVWSGTSEASEPKDVATLTQSLAKTLIAKMKADGVL